MILEVSINYRIVSYNVKIEAIEYFLLQNIAYWNFASPYRYGSSVTLYFIICKIANEIDTDECEIIGEKYNLCGSPE